MYMMYIYTYRYWWFSFWASPLHAQEEYPDQRGLLWSLWGGVFGWKRRLCQNNYWKLAIEIVDYVDLPLQNGGFSLVMLSFLYVYQRVFWGLWNGHYHNPCGSSETPRAPSGQKWQKSIDSLWLRLTVCHGKWPIGIDGLPFLNMVDLSMANC